MGKIAFCGAAGTGKTTLVEELFKLDQFKSYKRYTNVQRTLHKYLGDKFPHSSKTNDISQSAITGSFIVELLKEDKLICDRSLLDAFMYAETAKGVTLAKEIEYTFGKAMELYDYIFYLPIEFTVESDGFRDTNMEYVRKTDEALQKYIEKYKDKTKIIPLTGSIEQRLNKILKTLEG